MQTYAIIIGMQNDEVSKQVQEALFKAGFKWISGNKVNHTDAPVLFLNWCYYKGITYDTDILNITKDVTVLLPDYVINHAQELDGALKPYEIIPDGYRLVTVEERENYKLPDCALSCSKLQESTNFDNLYNYCWGSNTTFGISQRDYVAFIVPKDFQFKKLESETVPPDGYRLVTDYEKQHYLKHPGCKFWHTYDNKWRNVTFNYKYFYNDVTYCIPFGGILIKKTIEVSLEEIAKWKGVPVEVIRIKE